MRRIVALATVALVVASPAIAAGTLSGSFRSTISGKTPAAIDGTWVVSFKAHHKYTISRNGATVVRGQDTISTNKVTFGHETGPMACLGSQAAATYRWSLKNRKLTLKPVSEPCPGRKIVLTTHPLKKTG
jgi:hypothetical protein